MSTLTLDKITPLAGYVVVEPQEAQAQTQSGIYLPGGSEEKPQMGKVTAISETVVNDHGTTVKCPVKVGDTVLYKKWGGNEVKIGSKEVQVLKYEDMIAIVK